MITSIYLFGLIPVKFYCGGGGSTPAPPAPAPPPPPPAQLAKVPDAQMTRSSVLAANTGQGGVTPSTTLLTAGGGLGDPLNTAQLGKKTLLGG